jgi:hypothetical protein
VFSLFSFKKCVEDLPDEGVKDASSADKSSPGD